MGLVFNNLIMNKYPLVSIITPTLNAEKYLVYFLDCLSKQTYPKSKIEIIVADGGSTDNTIKIAKQYKAVVVDNPYVMAQPGVYVGMKSAKGELFIVLPGDNIFKQKNAIENIVNIFKDKNIYAAFPRHDSSKKDSLFTKYINTFTDPFNHFLYGNAANARTFKKIYKTVEHNNVFDIYNYTSYPIKPILGITQGFTVRRDFVKIWKDINDDINPVYDLIKQGKKIAYVYSVDLYHHTVRNVNHFFRKQRWAAKNALEAKDYGVIARKENLSFGQRLRIYVFPIYSISIIFPLIRAILGYGKDRELIWLFHPVISFISASAIIYEWILYKLNLSKDVSRL